MSNEQKTTTRHVFDDDSYCLICGMDVAEWHHLNTIARNNGGEYQPIPRCKPHSQQQHREAIDSIPDYW